MVSSELAAQAFKDLLTRLEALPPAENKLLVAAEAMQAEITLPSMPSWVVKILLLESCLFALHFILLVLCTAHLCWKQKIWFYRRQGPIWVPNTRLLFCLVMILGAPSAVATTLDFVLIYYRGFGYRWTILLDGLKFQFLWIAIWFFCHGIAVHIVLAKAQMEQKAKGLPANDRTTTLPKWPVRLLNLGVLLVPTVIPAVQTAILVLADLSFDHGIDMAKPFIRMLRTTPYSPDITPIQLQTLLAPAQVIYRKVLYAEFMRKLYCLIWGIVASINTAVSTPIVFRHFAIVKRLILRPSTEGFSHPSTAPTVSESGHGHIAPSWCTEPTAGETVEDGDGVRSWKVSNPTEPRRVSLSRFQRPPPRGRRQSSNAVSGSVILLVVGVGGYIISVSFIPIAIWGVIVSLFDRTFWTVILLYGSGSLILALAFFGYLFAYRPVWAYYFGGERPEKDRSRDKAAELRKAKPGSPERPIIVVRTPLEAFERHRSEVGQSAHHERYQNLLSAHDHEGSSEDRSIYHSEMEKRMHQHPRWI